jgi:hypothetical protein
MKELGEKISTDRKEKCTKNRGLVNQHKTGTISRWTLMQMLRGRSEHLWTCSECDEDTHIYNTITNTNTNTMCGLSQQTVELVLQECSLYDLLRNLFWLTVLTLCSHLHGDREVH